MVKPLTKLKKTLSKSVIVTILLFFVFNSYSIPVHAQLSSAQQQALSEGIDYFNTDTCGTSTSSSGTSVSNTGAAQWTSNVQPPYYLEEFVINVLEDIAKIANVPQSSTVTQEHTVALVAWAYAEGGNIANTDIFNPWNTGINDPSLVSGTPSGNGVQSFVSFDAGVTAAAITMTGSNQNRIEQTLIQPSSTAEQFMQNLTYYQNFPGNTFWAAADQNATVDGVPYTQAGYLQALTDQLNQARSNYNVEASVLIGPGQENTNHYTGTLQYSGGQTNPTGTNPAVSNSGCSGSGASATSVNCQNNGQQVTGNAAIACDVLKYDTLSYSQGWHSSGSVFHSRCNSTYPNQSPPAIGPNCATDCSGLVNIALYDVFNNNINDTTYTEVSDTGNFEKISASQLMPGDFIQPAAEAGDHVIVVISINGSKADTFAANTDQVPQPDQVSEQPYTLSSGDVYLRYIGVGSTYPR